MTLLAISLLAAMRVQLFPSAVGFHDFLSGLAGDKEESPTGDLSAILDPFMVQVIPRIQPCNKIISGMLWAFGDKS